MYIFTAARRAARALAALGLAALGACASSGGRFVWADKYVPPAAESGYAIAPGDVLNVRVWDNEKLSTKARVRADGRISVPLLDDVPVAGRQPPEIARDLEQRLRGAKLVLAPRVDVALDEASAVSISVLGRVTRPGAYTLQLGSGVAEALASAGGLTEFAHRDRIFVLRREPEPVRIRFTFGDLTGRSTRAATFRLRAGDVVVAE
jgi:polysaccharide export outer membrane protein